eukprot:gene10619-2741_t
MGTAASHPSIAGVADGTYIKSSEFAIVAESRIIRLQSDLEAANKTITLLQTRLNKSQAAITTLEKRNGQLQLAKDSLLKEVDKLRCIAEQHLRKDNSVIVPSPALPRNEENLKTAGDSPSLDMSKSYCLKIDSSTLNTTTKHSIPTGAHRQGVVAIVSSPSKTTTVIEQNQVMDDKTVQLIMTAFQGNPYVSKLTLSQKQAVAIHMLLCTYEPDDVVIKQGESGDRLYVITSGVVSVTTNGGQVKSDIGSGTVFGELALLYDCKRTATVTAKCKANVYAIDRQTFKIVTRQARQAELTRLVTLLKQMPLLEGLSIDYIRTLAELTKEAMFISGTTIVEEGRPGDAFYLIIRGTVTVWQNKAKIRTLTKGEHFGEGALLEAYNIRTATCKALTDVKCAVLSREAFLKHIIPLEALGRLSYLDIKEDDITLIGQQSINYPEFADVHLHNLEQKRILGTGAFGSVVLVKEVKRGRIFALKRIAKAHIIERGQEAYVVNEKKIMEVINCKFCAPLYQTFKDERYIYMLTEALMGGDLWRHLRSAGQLSDATTRFYTACVVQALLFLHTRNIVYRDLKPENIMISSNGYVKLVDFGFARRLSRGVKTWTFCGTPEYMAPEIVMNQGHDIAVDYWGLGVLVYELLSGRTPFACSDDMSTYNLIILGIDQICFDPIISGDARDLVLGLCRETTQHRLGCGKDGVKTIQKHRWFVGFDWEALANIELEAPFIPKLSSIDDCRYFGKQDKKIDPPPVIGPCCFEDDF